jgi:hypothetical protein
MDEATIRRIVQSEIAKLTGGAYQTRIDPAYIGGPPKTDDNLSGTAGTEQNYICFPPSIRPLVASDQAIMLPHGNGKAIIGTPQAPHLGKPLHDSYWFIPVESPSVETPLATGSRARRLTAPKSMPIAVATINVTTAQAASTATIKIYADDGTTTPVLLWTSNGIATTGTGIKKSTATSPFWVYMGYEYIIVYENDNAAVAVSAHTLSANADNILNDGAAQIATSAANIVGNSASNVVDFPLIKLSSA